MSDDLRRALDALVIRGTIDADQAEAIAAEVAAGSAPASEPHRKVNPLPEILGYIGGALVLSALINFLVSVWPDWSTAVQQVVLAAVIAVLVAGAALLTLGLGGRGRLRSAQTPPAARRLVALLLALTVVLIALLVTVTVAALWPDLQAPALPAGIVGLAAAAGAAWWVRGVLITLASAAATLWTAVGLFSLTSGPTALWLVPVMAVVVAAAWIVVATRLLDVPVLSEALGLAFAVAMLVPPAMEPLAGTGGRAELVAGWVCRGLLVALSLLALTLFARGARWPWAAGGVVAGVFAALAIGGDTFGWITGVFAAGVVLLMLSGALLLLRRRYMRSGAETPQTPSPLPRT